MEPRSSRLKDKKKDEGEILVKDQFVQDVLQNNGLLHVLCKGSSVVVLPRISLNKSNCSNQEGSFQLKGKARLFGSLCSPDLELKTRKSFVADCTVLDNNQGSKDVTGACSMYWKCPPICDDHNLSFSSRSDHVASPVGSQTMGIDPGSDKDQCDRVTSQGLFSCTTCGILCFASVAIVQPTETASQYLMSGNCSIFRDWGAIADCSAAFNDYASASRSNSSTGLVLKRPTDGLVDVPIEAATLMRPQDDENEVPNSTEARKETSSLGLLAMNYGDSDSDDDEADIPVEACEMNSNSSSLQSGYGCHNTEPVHHFESSYDDPSCSFYNLADGIPLKIDSYELTKTKFKGKDEGNLDHCKPETGSQHFASICSFGGPEPEAMTSAALVLSESMNKPFAPRSDEDSSRMHIFCLQHAVQVEQQLQSIGGSHVVLLCHPDYPALEAQAKKVAEELGNDKFWSDILFREASKEDEEIIQLALDSEEAIHGNGDWAVKLGINLCYSANLSRSPLYSKQMPYNRLIYNAFGCRSIVNDVNDAQGSGKLSARHRTVVAGKWCGKVWMSNQVHHLLAERDSDGQELELNFTGPVKADLKFQRHSEGTRTAEAALTTCKMERKRKISAEDGSFFKAESLGAEDLEEDFEVQPVYVSQHKDNLRNKRMKKEYPEPRMKTVRNGKQVEAEDSEEDFEVMSIFGEQHEEDSEEHSEGLPVSGKQHKDNLRNKRMKETPEPQVKSVRNSKQVEADGSEEDFEVMSISGKQHEEDSEEDFERLPVSNKKHRDNLRSRRTKKETPGPMKNVRNGKQLQEDSEEDLEVLPVSGKQQKNIMRNKRVNRETLECQLKSVRHGKQLEEDSEEESEGLPVSGKQHRKNLRIRQTKKGIARSLMESVRNRKQLEEDSEEDIEVTPISGQQLKNNLSKKRTKRETLEPQMNSVRNSRNLDEDSEEDFEAVSSSQQLKNNIRNKRMKKETLEPLMRSVRHRKQLEEVSEEDSEVLPDSGKLHKNNPRNKRMKETPEPQMKSLKNRKQLDSNSEDEMEGGPSTRLRKRIAKPSKESAKKVEVKPGPRKQILSTKAKKAASVRVAVRSNRTKIKDEAEFKCDLEGCSMSFGSKQELMLHKKNICPVKGCGKKFFSHKYLIQHRRVHLDDRPLKCPWKGCKMTFKWAWARTEHIRVHTGARPYVCAEPGCAQTFRFVSDFSRHKRKTGHVSKKVKK